MRALWRMRRWCGMTARRRRSGPSGKHTSHRVIVAIPADRLAIYRAAAERHGITLSAWLRLAADRQAERGKL